VTNLHHEIAARSDLIPQLDLSPDTLPGIRAFAAQAEEMMKPALSDEVDRRDRVIATDPQLVVRVFRSKRAGDAAACLYYVHGGGYVLGSYTMNDVVLDGWCVAFGCVAVSVEYRLAPETPYPGPLDDCYRGLTWTFEHAADLGVDPARIGIGGVSAGGGLAAALALLARDRDEVPVAFQLLECPMLDDRQSTPSSCDDDLVVWTREANTFGWRSYLGERYGDDDVPAYAAPGRARDLRGLPPAFVITGGADGFRDENLDYAVRLGQAGVPTDLTVIAGAPHGVQIFAGTTPERRWARAVEEWLRPHLRT